MHVDNVAGQAAAFQHQQSQAANRAQKAEDDNKVDEARSARAEETAQSDEPSRARQAAASENTDADRPEQPKDGGVDIRV
jgi:hypothetical protein